MCSNETGTKRDRTGKRLALRQKIHNSREAVEQIINTGSENNAMEEAIKSREATGESRTTERADERSMVVRN